MLELNNALPTWGWMASNGDHLFIYDGRSHLDNYAVVDGLFLASSGSTLTLRHVQPRQRCGDGQDYHLDMMLYGATPPRADARTKRPATSPHPPSCRSGFALRIPGRDHGDPTLPIAGNNMTEVFTVTNPLGTDIVLELNNDLPFWSWLASNGDHLTIYDGLGIDALLIYLHNSSTGSLTAPSSPRPETPSPSS